MYNPRRPLLGAFINGSSAQIFTVMLPRDEVVRRSHGLAPSVRSKLLDDWDAIAAAANAFKERQAESRESVVMVPARDPVAVASEAVEDNALYPVETVAMVINRSARRVKQLIGSGELEGVMVHYRWMVTEESIGDYGLRKLLERQAGR
jgi:hypothetical protein